MTRPGPCHRVPSQQRDYLAEEVDLKREQPGGVRVFPGIWWHGGGEPVGGTPQPLPGALGVCLLREEIRDRSLQQDWH